MNIFGNKYEIGDIVKTATNLENPIGEELPLGIIGEVTKYPDYYGHRDMVWVYFKEIDKAVIIPTDFLQKV